MIPEGRRSKRSDIAGPAVCRWITRSPLLSRQFLFRCEDLVILLRQAEMISHQSPHLTPEFNFGKYHKCAPPAEGMMGVYSPPLLHFSGAA